MDLSEGKISTKLIRFSIPIIISLVGAVAYQIADNIIVSNCCGQNALATISSISGVVALGYILLNGFSQAFTIIASKNIEDKQKVYDHAFILSFAGGALLALLFLVFGNLMIKIMQVPSDISKEALACLIVYGISFFPSMMMELYTSLFNGFNDSKTPMYINMGANVLNIILDYVFLGIFDLPVIYAPIASLIAITINYLLNYLFFKRNYRLSFHLNIESAYLWNIFKLSGSMMFQQSIMNICGMMMSIKINTMGIETITINTATENILNLYILAFVGFTDAYSIFIGTNLGKEKYTRIKEGLHEALKIGITLMLVMGIIAYFSYFTLLKLYISDLSAFQLKFASFYRYAMLLSFIAYFFKYLLDGYPKAYEEMKYYLTSSFLNLGVRMIVLYALVPFIGINALGICLLASIYISMLYNIYIYFTKYYKRLL